MKFNDDVFHEAMEYTTNKGNILDFWYEAIRKNGGVQIMNMMGL